VCSYLKDYLANQAKQLDTSIEAQMQTAEALGKVTDVLTLVQEDITGIKSDIAHIKEELDDKTEND